jgi:error-prone DNA polymerase
VYPVHVNRSQAACAVEQRGIRLGFEYVAGLGQVGAERVVAARPPKGYRDLADFCRRTKLPPKLIENLILAGGMSDWEQGRRALLWDLGRTHYQEEELDLIFAPDEVALEPMDEAEEMLYEYRVTGVTTQGHVMELYRERLQRAQALASRELQQAKDGQRLRVGGLVAVRQQPPTAKGFAFFTLEDEWGLINVIVRPDVFQAQRETLVSASVLVVEGVVQRAHGQISVMMERAGAAGR